MPIQAVFLIEQTLKADIRVRMNLENSKIDVYEHLFFVV